MQALQNCSRTKCVFLNRKSVWVGVLAVIAVGVSHYSLIAQTNCVAPPPGLVSWWKAEGSSFDEIGANNGTLFGNATYGSGRVGQAFVFDGQADGVSLGNPASLRLQDFTIETWIKRGSTTTLSLDGNGNGTLFGYGAGGYGFYLSPGGYPALTKAGIDNVTSTTAITDTSFHHIAVTKSGSTVKFYIDGTLKNTFSYNPIFLFTTSAAIGGVADEQSYTFLGTIDEVSFYNRALTGAEIQGIFNADSAGKCTTPTAPVITSQPASQAVTAGAAVDFSVGASGTAPLNYQWQFNGTNISGQTSSSLSLVNVQDSNAGNYSVVVTNIAGSVLSSNATLTVNPPPPCANPPTGLVSWWKADGSLLDQIGTNNGTFYGNATYGSGRVGQGFVLDGQADGVSLGNPASLRLQDFTIETWVKRGSTTTLSRDGNGNGTIFGYGPPGGYGFYLSPGGYPALTKAGIDNVTSSTAITDTNFHHIAVTKSGSSVIFYIDGALKDTFSYNPGFTFTTSAAIGGVADNQSYTFLGTIDEVSFYNRALTGAEIQGIYNADASGKCSTPVAPMIILQPASQTVTAGVTVNFSVGASGTTPLSYQWQFNGTNISSQTSSSLSLVNVQDSNAGNYSVVITNIAGSVVSSNATLTVNPPPPCANPPAGLVAWWRAESNTLDQLGGINGTFYGNATYGSGRVGQGFVLDGQADGVSLGNPASLRLQDFTIETWVKRGSTTTLSLDGNGNGTIFGYGPPGGYGFYLSPGGYPALTKAGINNVTSTNAIIDTNFHHIAVTKSGSNVIFYIDGALKDTFSYDPGFTFTTSAAIGGVADNQSYTFLGTIDEVSFYNRALTGAEVQGIYNADLSGKCANPVGPVITAQPASQTVTVGSTVTISVTAAGSTPLYYQWLRNGTNVGGATASSLVLTNLQFADAGSYAAIVSNSVDSITSSNATLTVNFPPASVRVVNSAGPAGGTVTVPINLVANGNENAVGFSLNFNPTMLSYVSASLGSNAPGGTLLPNTNQLASGRLGLAVGLPAQATFAAGTSEAIEVTFSLGIVTNASLATISFGDAPIGRQLSDAAGHALAATYSGGGIL